MEQKIGLLCLDNRLKGFLVEYIKNKNLKKQLEKKYNITVDDKVIINNYIKNNIIHNKYKLGQNNNNLFYCYQNPEKQQPITFSYGPVLGYNVPLQYSQQQSSDVISLDPVNIINKLKPFKKFSKVPILNFNPIFTNDTIEQHNLCEEMECALPSRDYKRKSYGYTQPVEHYFDYISNDIQCPEHCVLPFPQGGISSRLINKITTEHK